MIYVIIIGLMLAAVTLACALLWKRQERPEGTEQGEILIPCTAKTDALELTVRCAYWGELLEDRDKRRQIVIVLINAGENIFRARALAAELAGVEAVDITALADHLLRKYSR